MTSTNSGIIVPTLVPAEVFGDFSCGNILSYVGTMAQNKLTDPKIQNLRPGAKRYSVSDGGGLFIEVLPSGSRSWRMRYRLEGRQEKVTYGQYPAYGLAEARVWRDKCKSMLAHGQSPMQDTAAKKGLCDYPDTLKEFVERWLDEVVSKSNRNPSNIRRVLEKDILPFIGHKRLADVTAKDVLDITDRIKARGSDQVALLARNIIKRIYGFAVARREVDSNPGAEVEAKYIGSQRSREVSLTDEDIGILFRGLYKSNMRRSYVLALHLLLICMIRKGELVNAEWKEFNLEAATWEIPGSRMKNGKPHVVYLSSHAVDLLMELEKVASGSDFVLPSRSSLNKPISITTLNTAIRALDLDVKGFVIHDFRRTASTLLNEAQKKSGKPRFAPDWIEKALGHEHDGIRGVYNKAEYSKQRRKMLQWWADFVDNQIFGDSPAVRASNVIRARSMSVIK